MTEKIFWTVMALIATVAGCYFFLVPKDMMMSGVAFIAALVFLNWRGQAVG